jgi:hypothetical protein
MDCKVLRTTRILGDGNCTPSRQADYVQYVHTVSYQISSLFDYCAPYYIHVVPIGPWEHVVVAEGSRRRAVWTAIVNPWSRAGFTHDQRDESDGSFYNSCLPFPICLFPYPVRCVGGAGDGTIHTSRITNRRSQECIASRGLFPRGVRVLPSLNQKWMQRCAFPRTNEAI